MTAQFENTTPLTALIADDEPLARDLLKAYLKRFPHVSIIGEAKDGKEAIRKVKKLKPRVLFLDIQMPEANGFEVLAQLRSDEMPIVVFVTAYEKHAIKAFELNATDYLLKPFDESRFEKSMKRIALNSAQMENHTALTLFRRLADTYQRLAQSDLPEEKKYLTKIPVKTSTRIFFVETGDIQYIEAAGDYVTLYTTDQKYLVNNSLNNLQTELNPELFLRIHRSTLVNASAIIELEPHANGEYFVRLNSGAKLKMSRTYKENLKRAFGNSL